MLDDEGNSPDRSIQVLNLRTHTVTELPGSKGIFSPRWSPDGRYVAALTFWDLRLSLFDFKTQKWEKLAAELDKSFPVDTLVQRYWLPTIHAAVALERQDPNRAIELLKVARAIELGQISQPTMFLCLFICVRKPISCSKTGTEQQNFRNT